MLRNVFISTDRDECSLRVLEVLPHCGQLTELAVYDEELGFVRACEGCLSRVYNEVTWLRYQRGGRMVYG